MKQKSPVGHENAVIFQNSKSWIGYLFSIKDYFVEEGNEPLPTTTPVSGRDVSREFLKMFKQIGKKI
ncbi:MAG: hypothetical protein ACTSYU_06310 [Promethearchaeota archaeon]